MTQYLKIDGRKLECQWHNPQSQSNPALVFLHEGLGCTRLWRDFPQKLSQQTGCPAFVFSRFGYGDSDACLLPRKVNFMHTEALTVLPRVLQAAGIKDHIIVGHSDGGSIGIIYAGTPLASQLKGLVTAAAHVFCEKITVESIFQAKINYEQGNLKKGLEKYHGKNTRYAFRGWNDVWLNPVFMHFNIEKYLPKIQVPMLALQGRKDQYGTLLQLDAISKKANRVQANIIENCKHSPHLEQESQVLETMTHFILSILNKA